MALTSSDLFIRLRPVMFSDLARIISTCLLRFSRDELGLPVPWLSLLGVRPWVRRVLLTVRAAMAFARLVDAPRRLLLCLMCSYWRSSFLDQDEGISLTPPFDRENSRSAERYAIRWVMQKWPVVDAAVNQCRNRRRVYGI